MQEVKRPQKPLIYFYVAMILAILVFNCLVVPYLAGKAIEDVDYGTFMTRKGRNRKSPDPAKSNRLHRQR